MAKLTARCFAELYLIPLMRKMLKMAQQYQQREREIMVSGEWTSMDPRSWNTDMYVTTNVGLGHENRDSQAAASTVILNAQERAAQIGMAGPEHFWESAKDLVQALGRKFPEKYFVDPTTDAGKQHIASFQEQRAQQPDPAAMKAQQDGQLKAAKLQQDGQLGAMKLQQEAQLASAKAEADMQIELLKLQQSAAGDQAKTAADFESDMAKVQADYAAKLEQINRETALAVQKMQAEFELATMRQDAEVDLKLREQNLKALTAQHATDTQASVSGNGLGGQTRFGGAVG